MTSEGLRPIWLRPFTSVCRSAPLTIARGTRSSVAVICVRGNDHGLAHGERIGLRDLRRLGHADRQGAVSDGDRRDLDVLSDDDRSGPLIDHDPRRRIGPDLEIAELGDEARRRNILRLLQDDGRIIARGCNADADTAAGYTG